MSRQAELEALIFDESCAEDGIVIMIRMGQDPGRERVRRLNNALQELDELTRGQTVLDRRLAYALFGLAVYPDQETRSWTRAGKDVYAEKPLALTIDEGEVLRRVVEQTGHSARTATEQARRGERPLRTLAHGRRIWAAASLRSTAASHGRAGNRLLSHGCRASVLPVSGCWYAAGTGENNADSL